MYLQYFSHGYRIVFVYKNEFEFNHGTQFAQHSPDTGCIAESIDTEFRGYIRYRNGICPRQWSRSTVTPVDSVRIAVSQLSRSDLLRATQHLVDGLLRVQIRASAAAPSYLRVVLPCLFHLINNEHQDVRIAADEGINKLIKVNSCEILKMYLNELII